jgi:hypothetical protein
MAHRTYAFVASPRDVATTAFTLPIATLFPTLCERHVGATQLMVLAALLSGRDLRTLAQESGSGVVFVRAAKRYFPVVRDLSAEWGCDPGDCPLVLRMPPGYTRQLARLTDEQRRRYGKEWARMPWWGWIASEGALPSRQAARLALYLRDLSLLAARATEERALYLWSGEE